MLNEKFKAEVRRLFLENTVDPAIVYSMCKAHDAQMKRNARLRRKNKMMKGQVLLNV
jgi:hypothetical protein